MDLSLEEQVIRVYPDNESHQLAYKYGYKIALRTIKEEIQQCAIDGKQFIILHVLDFIDKQLGEK